MTELLPTFGYPITPTVTLLLTPSFFEQFLINSNSLSAPIALDDDVKSSANFSL